MIKFISLLMMTLVMASVSVFGNEEMTTNVETSSPPATPAQGTGAGNPTMTGMTGTTGTSEVGNSSTQREPARRHHKRKHRRHRRHRR
ncbi:MAG: hypothetical protein ACKOA8_19820 [Deltaproteobacteria bacterium]